MDGWFKLHRAINKHWIYKDAEYLKVWIEMLVRARYSPDPSTDIIEGQLITLNYSEFIYGRNKWSERLGISEQRLRTLMKKLLKDKMIEVVSHYNKFTVYRIVNYQNYNHQSNQQDNQHKHASLLGETVITNQQENHLSNQQLTSNQPSVNQQLTTKEESKESKNDKKNNSSSGIGEIDPIFGQAYEMMQQHFHFMNGIQQDEISRYLDNGLNLEVLQEAINKTKLGGKDMNYLFGILRKCEEQGVKTLDQYKEREAQHQRDKEFKQQRQQRSTYNKPTKPVIPVMKNEPQPQVSQEELDKALEMARRLDSTRKTG